MTQTDYRRQLLTTSEVASVLRVKPRTVCNWIHRGKLPAVLVGGSYRIHVDELNGRLPAGERTT